MTEELKNKILYSDIILELIQTHKVIAIYLGGSRLLGLDSPNSDYDIVVLTKDNSLNNYQKRLIPIEGYRIHTHINPIQNVIKLIKHPETLNGYHDSLIILDAILYKNKDMIYSTSKAKALRDSILKHKEALVVLCLEARLNAIYNTISFPIYHYNKRYYHYLLMHYLLHNFITTKQLHLTPNQIKILKDFKSNRVIPASFYESLKSRYPHKYFTSTYKYEEAYKEMKQYE